jgi:hypothetical protein
MQQRASACRSEAEAVKQKRKTATFWCRERENRFKTPTCSGEMCHSLCLPDTLRGGDSSCSIRVRGGHAAATQEEKKKEQEGNVGVKGC